MFEANEEERAPLNDDSSRGRSRNRDWVVKIADSIREHSLLTENTIKRDPRQTTRRVVRDVRDINPKVYSASEFSFGLIDRTLPDPQKSRADRCKVAMTIALLKDLGQTADYWGELCKRVVPDPEDIQENYDEHERSAFSPAEVQSVLTLDAVFLAGYLGNWQDDFTDRFPAIKSALARITDNQTNYQILQDLIKVENQIPLIPIENVLHVLMGEVGGDTDKFVRETMHKMCYDVVTTFSSSLPGYDPQQPKAAMDGVSFVECRNFLDCVYTVLTRKLRAKMKQIKVPADNGPEASTETSTEKSTHTPPGPESSTKKSADTPPAAVCCFMASNKKSVDNIPGLLPSVTELKKAGIEFRGRQGFDDVVFKTSCVKGTLYLPSLHIYDTTESLWRNLVAHEQQLNDGAEFGRHPDFINFIDLMDSLIDSEHDVSSK